MTPWMGLLKKDFRLTLPWFLGGLGLIVALNFLLTWMIGMVAFSYLLVLAHFLYFPAYLFISLWLEGKQMHQWLHTPRPAWQLLLSKLVVGVPFMILSLGVSGLFPTYLLLGPTDLFGINPALEPSVFWSDLGLGFLMMLWTSFLLGLFLLVIWSVYRWLYIYIGKWSWVITAAGAFAFLYLYTRLLNSPLYTSLSKWGPTFKFKMLEREGANLGPLVYTGEILLDLLIAAGFFALSHWILEERMEV